MKKSHTMCALFLLAVFVGGCSSSRPVDTTPQATTFTIEELLGRMPVRDSVEARWVFSSLTAMGQTGVTEMCARLSQAGSPAAARAEYALQGLASYVVRPGYESERANFVAALGKVLAQPLSTETASFIMRLLQMTGKTDAIPLLTKYLLDERLGEPAVQALLAIRTGVSGPMLATLPGAVGPNRITLIKALGELRSREAVGLLMKEASSKDNGVRMATLFALANIGDSVAGPVLANAAATESSFYRSEALWNIILFARRLQESGNSQGAIGIGKAILAQRRSPEEGHVRAAALNLLVEADGSGALDSLIATLGDDDKSLRVAALGLASRYPGEAATARWVGVMPSCSPEVQCELITMLAERGDNSAYPALVTAMSSADSAVRASAIIALVRLKGGESLPPLMTLLRRTLDNGDIAAVKKGLGLLPAAQVTQSLIDALPSLTPPATVAMIDVLAGYGAQVPVAPILALTKSPQSTVRLAAIKALGSIATANEQAQVLEVLLSTKTEAEQSAAQRSFVSVSNGIPDLEVRADRILEALPAASPEERKVLLRVLGRIGGGKAMTTLLQQSKSPDADLHEAAVRALADWPTLDGYEPLLSIAQSKEKLNLRVLALRGCVRIVENAPINAATAVRYHERTLAVAERAEEKRLVLGALGSLRRSEALKLVLPYLANDTLGVDAAAAAGKIASGITGDKDEAGESDVIRTFVESRVSPRIRSQVTATFDARRRKNDPPDGFRMLFNGRDLTGWKGLVENPVVRASMNPQQLAVAQLRADSSMRAHWSVVDGILVFDGKGENLCTAKEYENFEMLVDWRIEKDGDSGIYLRGSPQVQIWDIVKWPEGSGGLYNNQKGPSKPLLRADNPAGEWNTFRIRMIGDRVTVFLNDVLVVDSVALENYWDRSIPIFTKGQIELQSHSTPLFFRNIFIREIPRRKHIFSGSLFNGVNLNGWRVVAGKEGSWGAVEGVLFTTGQEGGWLSTSEEYGDFQLDLDFRVPDGGNSGVFIRSPHQGDPAYTGIEIQILDDYAPQYANLKSWQYCGSVYGVKAPSLRASKKAGEWQHIQIIADGPRIKVALNGQHIVDEDLIAHMDKETLHPGLKRRAGFIGLQSHGARVEYRNITLTELR